MDSSSTLIEWNPQQNWSIRWASPGCEQVLGRRREDLLAPSFSYLSIVHPQDRSKLEASIRAAVQHGVEEFSPDEYRIVRPDGALAVVSHHGFVERTEGLPTALRGYLTDITRFRQEQARLIESEQRLRLVLQGTRLGIWDWNPQTNAVTFDERWAAMLGHQLDEIPFHVDSWSSRVHPDDLDACFADLKRHISGETEFYENIHRMRHKNGEWRYILDRGRIMERDETGNPTRFTGTHTDITDQKRAELAAVEGNRLKTLFLATMSHEIRTPLNGVLGLLQLLDDGSLDTEQHHYLRLIRESGESLLVIINDLLDLSKLEERAIELDPHDFDFELAIEACVELFRPRANDKRVRLEWSGGDPPIGRVHGDSYRLRQVITNLVSNAVKFTEEGKVSVRCTRDGPGQLIEVRDSGPGIADTSRIWQPFQQENAGTARRFGGTGLGLTIVRELARLMGGSVTVESTLGAGSTFAVRLELPPAVAPFSAERHTECPPSPSAFRVLVAEDNRVNQVVARGVLRKLGIEPKIVTDGRQAVDAVREQRFDVILMDLHMPVLDGVEATRAIRALPGGDQPRIVALTADALSQHREAALAAGMDGFLSKPFRIHQLRDQLAGR